MRPKSTPHVCANAGWRYPTWSIVLALGCLVSPISQARAQKTQMQPYTVFAGDYSHIDGSTVEKAVKLAEGILERAGVSARLVVCSVSKFQGVLVAKCPEIGRLPDAFLKVVERNASRAAGRAAMGLAMPALSSTQPNTAYVFYESVRQAAESGNCTAYRVLGHAMAHEIGHLLGCEHSKSGIMQPDWKRSIIGEMSRGMLAFGAGQGEIMRSNVERRAERRSAD